MNMENFYTIEPEKLSVSVRAFQKLLKQRDSFTDAQILISTSQFVFLTRKDGKKIRIQGMMPPTTSGFANHLATDKLASAALLAKLEVKQPETAIATDKSFAELLQKYPKIVVKPVDGAHGNGITTDIQSLDEAKQAWALAMKYSENGIVIAQEQLESEKPEIRAVVVGGKFVCAFKRIPAQVTGDGVHSVKELIKIENETIRTIAYASDLAFIDEEYSNNYLRQAGIGDHIPAKGEKVQVIKMCNIGRGGTVEDVTDEFPEELQREAEKIAKEFELPVMGVDYLDDSVLEVNSNPMLYYPAKTRSDLGVEKLLDYLETI